MQARPALHAVLLASILALAGCVQADSSAPQSAAPGPGVASGPAQFDDTTGGIDGYLTDEELAPIAGAAVGLVVDGASSTSVLTDEAGHFAFSHLQPGDHVVAATALGYTSASKRVSVVAGGVQTVTLALAKLAVAEPYSTVLVWRGENTGAMLRASPECLYLSQSVPEDVPNRNLLKTCNGARVCTAGDCEAQVVDELLKETDPKTIVAELTWRPQSGATGRAYWFDLSGPNVSRQAGGSIDQADKRYWMVHRGAAPIQIRIDLPETLIEREVAESDWYSYPGGEGCEQSSCAWLWRAWPSYCDLSSSAGGCDSTPVDYGVQQAATYEVYVTIFYMEPAPADFTSLPDA